MYNSFLATDFYKVTHLMQFKPEIVQLTSYLTPRGSRFKNIDKMVWFGLEGFIQKYLVEGFKENFFDKSLSSIKNEVYEVLKEGLGYDATKIQDTFEKVAKLHKLGYLPIAIHALREGTRVPMGIPAMEISTTKLGFAWVGQAIESLISCSIWHPCISATIAFEYGKIAYEAYQKTSDNGDYRRAMCDFSMRGHESYESAVASGAAFLTAFYNCSTIEARRYIEDNYEDREEVPIYGLTSTEHSVMTSDFAITGDEASVYKRLLTEVYPNNSFSVVADSYDFWNVLTNILPELKGEIERHNGFLGVRHDSAEPVTALCGIPIVDFNKISDNGKKLFIGNEVNFNIFIEKYVAKEVYPNVSNEKIPDEFFVYCKYNNSENICLYSGVYKIKKKFDDDVCCFFAEKVREERTWEDKGIVETIYELFGGSVNNKGYIVVNPKLKAVYGDSITIPRAKEIYDRLEKKGFSAENVSLGVGSFSMECIEEDGVLKPFTRDSFSIAIKATYGLIQDNYKIAPIEIYKDPKGFSQKKSLKGICIPYYEGNELKVKQQATAQDIKKIKSAFVPYFVDGQNFSFSYNSIREKINREIIKEANCEE